MAKKKNLPYLENIEITGIAAEGKALTRVNDCVVFVPYCVPGDIVNLQITKKKHNFMEARVESFVSYSDKRCEPVCPHYGECGGCKWQILPYEEQLRYKQQQIVDNLTRIGKIELPEIMPILGSEKIYHYRNKVEFTFADRKWLSWDAINAAGGMDKVDKAYGLGFHIPNCFDKVLDITECHLMDPINDAIRNSIRAYAKERNLSFYNAHSQEGFLRNLILRNNHKGEYMLIVVFGAVETPYMASPSQQMSAANTVETPFMASPSQETTVANAVETPFMASPHLSPAQAREDLLAYIKENFPQITSLLYVINPKCNDTIGDLPVHVYFGNDHIIEEMEDLQFKVGPKSFYQTNTEQAYELYKVARNFAGLTGNELVFDLYTGTGTIANFVAHQARQVIGIEYVPEAIEDAKVNAKINNLDNTLFFAGDMKDILNTDFIKQYGRPDVIITDPPRAGMHEDVINTILFAAPERIVYVSCNPATQARDLNLLDGAYKVAKVQPVDMFPHTQHVENVVLLVKRSHDS